MACQLSFVVPLEPPSVKLRRASWGSSRMPVLKGRVLGQSSKVSVLLEVVEGRRSVIDQGFGVGRASRGEMKKRDMESTDESDGIMGGVLRLGVHT